LPLVFRINPVPALLATVPPAVSCVLVVSALKIVPKSLFAAPTVVQFLAPTLVMR
jgi:hypothetical protein